jgi:HEAT repeat protein
VNKLAQGPEKIDLDPPKPQNLGWLIGWAAEQGLGVPAGPQALQMLQGAVQAEDRPDVRAMAIRSLSDIGRSDALELVKQALRDPDANVRETAYYAQVNLQRAWHPASTGQ